MVVNLGFIRSFTSNTEPRYNIKSSLSNYWSTPKYYTGNITGIIMVRGNKNSYTVLLYIKEETCRITPTNSN